MSTKKKPASKPAGPTALLKLKVEKFPDRQIPVYFDVPKKMFRATFGFNDYEAFSVGSLEGKIKAAIGKGATPDVRWVPVISINDQAGGDFKPTKDSMQGDLSIEINRMYISVTKTGICQAPWGSAEKSRTSKRESMIFGYERRKLKMLPKLPWKAPEKWADSAVLPHTEEAWQKLSALIYQVRTARESLHAAMASGDFSKVFVPKAAAATKKPAPKKAGTHNPMLNSTKDLCICAPKRRTDQLRTNPYCTFPHADSKQPELPLAAAAEKPIVTGKLAPGLQLAGKSAKKSTRDRGDNSAREHLLVKYQGKQLTLGHGPLGNYLVEALRKTYSDIHSAFCLKDNQVQVSRQGREPFTITGADFERLINHPEPPSQSGDQYGRQALQNLLKLIDDMQPGDPPVAIPALILAAAGFPASATAEIQDEDEIIVRVPKKAPQFISVFAFEERIRSRIPDAVPEKAAVNE